MAGDEAGDLDAAAAGRAEARPAIVRMRDLLGRQQRSGLAGVAGLGAPLPAGTRLLRLRAMRIGRGWRGRIAGVGTQLLFQCGDALGEHVDLPIPFLKLARQVIDARLRLFQGAHARRRLRRIDVHAHQTRRAAFRLRAADTNSLCIAAGQHFVTSALTPAISLQGELLRKFFPG